MERKVIEDILSTAMKVSPEKERIMALFQRSGIQLNDEPRVIDITGSPAEAIKRLMANLSEFPVIKISAKQILRKAGIAP